MTREQRGTGLRTPPICLPEATCYSAAAAVDNTSPRKPATDVCELQVTVNHRYQVTLSTYLAAAATLGLTASYISARYMSCLLLCK